MVTSRVVIAVDPHKASWTAAAVDASLQPLATVRVPVSREGYRALRRFARRWPQARWAIEGAAGLGAPLTTRLRADDIEVIDVPAKLAARVRLLSSGHGRKSDAADALSVGIAALNSQTLNSVQIDPATRALRAVVEHRDDLVKTRTQTINRLHVVLTHLVDGGARRELTADHAAELLRGVRPRDAAGKTATGSRETNTSRVVGVCGSTTLGALSERNHGIVGLGQLLVKLVVFQCELVDDAYQRWNVGAELVEFAVFDRQPSRGLVQACLRALVGTGTDHDGARRFPSSNSHRSMTSRRPMPLCCSTHMPNRAQ